MERRRERKVGEMKMNHATLCPLDCITTSYATQSQSQEEELLASKAIEQEEDQKFITGTGKRALTNGGVDPRWMNQCMNA